MKSAASEVEVLYRARVHPVLAVFEHRLPIGVLQPWMTEGKSGSALAQAVCLDR